MDPSQRTIGKSGKVIHAQTREVIANVMKFMREEAEIFKRTHQPMIPLSNYKQRALKATGISGKAYKSIMKEAAEIESGLLPSFQTPRLKKRKNIKSNLPTQEIVTVTVDHDYHITECESPIMKIDIEEENPLEITENFN